MVENSIHIERAAVADAQLISDLSNATFIETYRGTCTDDDLVNFINKCFAENIIEEELQSEDEFYFIAFTDGLPAGYMRIKEDYNDLPAMKKYKALELKRIYVLQEYQSNKVGTALMNFALQFAADKNYEVLWLGVWEGNEKARRFYKNFGFEDTGERAIFYIGNTAQTDHWLIKKTNSF